jgi:diguanylate cyclase (GGDEF)-like protein
VSSNLPLSLIIFDVNGLKLTNDAFGHQAGDLLLQKVARILQDHCGSEEVLARPGWGEMSSLCFSPGGIVPRPGSWGRESILL